MDSLCFISHLKGVLMKALNKILLTVSLSSFVVLSYAAGPGAAASGASDISGTYTCAGHDPNSTPPDFKENIVFKKSGDVYSVQLIHNGSVFPYNLGTAVVNPDLPNAVSYVYWDPKSPSTMGSEIFMINADGSLDGAYLDSNKTKAGSETCTKSAS
jgi:hypothetical protein